MNQDGATKSLAKFAAELEFNKIPENILNYLKLLFLDGVGCCIHGNTLEWTKTLEESNLDSSIILALESVSSNFDISISSIP